MNKSVKKGFNGFFFLILLIIFSPVLIVISVILFALTILYLPFEYTIYLTRFKNKNILFDKYNILFTIFRYKEIKENKKILMKYLANEYNSYTYDQKNNVFIIKISEDSLVTNRNIVIYFHKLKPLQKQEIMKKYELPISTLFNKSI